MAEQPATRIPHLDQIDELMGKDVARLLDPAERAVELHDHIRNFAHLYGLEALQKAIKTGIAFYQWDKNVEAQRMRDAARDSIWESIEGQI